MRVPSVLLILPLLACQRDTQTLPQFEPFLEDEAVQRSFFGTEWLHAATIVAVEGRDVLGLQGLTGPLARVRLELEGELAVLRETSPRPGVLVAAWPMAGVGAEHVRVRWDDNRTHDGLRFDRGDGLSLALRRPTNSGARVPPRLSRSTLELTEELIATPSPAACALLLPPRASPEDCQPVRVWVRQALAPLGGLRSFERTPHPGLRRAGDAETGPVAWRPFVAASGREPEPLVLHLAHDATVDEAIAARAAAAAWEEVLRPIVAELLERSEAELPPLLEVRDNTCSAEVLEAWAARSESWRAVVCEDAACSFEEIAPSELAARCDALEAATLDRISGESAFTWERPGSLRSSLIWFLDGEAAWGAAAPLLADPETGQIVGVPVLLRRGLFADRRWRGSFDGAEDGPVVAARAEERAARMETELASEAFAVEMGRRIAAGVTPEGEAPWERLTRRVAATPGALEVDPIYGHIVLDVLERPGLVRAFSAPRRGRLAALARRGWALLDDEPHPGWLRLTGGERRDSETVAALVERLRTHHLAKTIGLGLGLAPNLAGSWDGAHHFDQPSSSVLDVLAAEAQVRMLGPGRTDVALLWWALAGRLEVEDGEGRRRFRRPEAVGPDERILTHLTCTAADAYLRPTIGCQAGDLGTSPRAVFAHHYRAFSTFYAYAFSPSYHPTWAERRLAVDPVAEPLAFALLAAQTLERGELDQPGFILSFEGRELLTTAAHGLNLITEILTAPHWEAHCEWEGVLLPFYDRDCPQRKPLLGEARPVFEWSSSYTAHHPAFGLLHQDIALFAPTLEHPAGPRGTGRGTSFLRLFAEPLAHLVLDRAAGVPVAYHEVAGPTAHWCSDEERRIEPGRSIEVVSGRLFPGASAACPEGRPIQAPRFWSAAGATNYALFLYDGLVGEALAPQLAVHVRQELPNDAREVCSVVHPRTGIEYVAIRDEAQRPCRVIDQAAEWLHQGIWAMADGALAAVERLRQYTALTRLP